MTQFLFDPERVDRLLAHLPTLGEVLPPRASEGGSSAGFDRLRKTERQVYRFLSNPHYPDLRHALRAIDRTYCAGCRFGELLSTGDYELFQSHVAEVRAADHFLARSLCVETIRRADSRTADLRVAVDNLAVTVEVFTRREWLGLRQWTDSLRDTLKNLDISRDYVASVTTRSQRLDLWLPWDLADALIRPGSAGARSALFADFEIAVDEMTPYNRTYDHSKVDLETEVELGNVRPAGDAPARGLFISAPGFGGYSPAGMLRRIIEGPLRDKAGHGQAHASGGDVRCLLVDLTHAFIADDLRAPAHAREAEDVVATVDPREFELDIIVFYRPYVGRLRGKCDHFAVFDDDVISRDHVGLMFGPVP